LRTVLARTLEKHGFRVIEASSADHAIACAKEAPKIDLLISDVRMPGTSGVDLARTLLRENAGLAVLLMSGYLEDEIEGNPEIRERAIFLQKPFNMRHLIGKVGEAFHKQARAGAPKS